MGPMGAMTRVGTLLVVTGLATLAACGGDEPAPTAPVTSATAGAGEGPAGTPAPEALSRFTCQDDDGRWRATGVVANEQKGTASYLVTVYVGPPDGETHAARAKRLENIRPGESAAFEIAKIPNEGDGPCHVQVLRLDR